MSAVLLQCNDKQKCATKDVCPELSFPSGRDDDDLSYTSKCTIFFHPTNFSVIFISAGAREDSWENWVEYFLIFSDTQNGNVLSNLGGSYAKIESEWKEARLASLGNKMNKPWSFLPEYTSTDWWSLHLHQVALFLIINQSRQHRDYYFSVGPWQCTYKSQIPCPRGAYSTPGIAGESRPFQHFFQFRAVLPNVFPRIYHLVPSPYENNQGTDYRGCGPYLLSAGGGGGENTTEPLFLVFRRKSTVLIQIVPSDLIRMGFIASKFSPSYTNNRQIADLFPIENSNGHQASSRSERQSWNAETLISKVSTANEKCKLPKATEECLHDDASLPYSLIHSAQCPPPFQLPAWVFTLCLLFTHCT